MIPFMRAMVDLRYRKGVLCCGAQMGKSASSLNVIGHRLADDPTPILYVGPTRSFVENIYEPQLLAMLKSSDDLWSKTAKGKKLKKVLKTVNGADIRLGWSNSATELAGQAAGLAIIDERDRMAGDIEGEGDPGTIIEARGATYPGFRLATLSTPLVGNVDTFVDEWGLERWQVADPEDVQSPTWRQWQKGTRHEFAWPCPSCEQYFVPRMKHLKGWKKGATPQEARRDAYVECPNCGHPIEDHWREKMNARGFALAVGQRVVDGKVIGDEPDNDIFSLWISGLCSPWKSFNDRAAQWIEAVRSGEQTEVQGIINTSFGELYKLRGEAPDWQRVAALRGGYLSGSVPLGVQVVTCAVDVQKDRLVFVIRGWGYNLESWLIKAGEIHAPPDTTTEDDAVWNQLSTLIKTPVGDHPITLCLIDSGYRPGDKWRRPDHVVYSFARRHKGLVRAIKGRDGKVSKPISMSPIDVTFNGQKIKRGLDLWHLDSHYFKSWVHSQLTVPEGAESRWHLPSDATEDYCMQVVAEAMLVLPSGRTVWQKVRRDNHFLDCEMMQIAAATMLQLNLLQPPVQHQEEAKSVDSDDDEGFSRRRGRGRSRFNDDDDDNEGFGRRRRRR